MIRILASAAIIAATLTACSNTDDSSAPVATSSTAYQQEVDDFCRDVADALENQNQGDPEDNAEQLSELVELANQLSAGSNDDMNSIQSLTKCKEELQAAINE